MLHRIRIQYSKVNAVLKRRSLWLHLSGRREIEYSIGAFQIIELEHICDGERLAISSSAIRPNVLPRRSAFTALRKLFMKCAGAWHEYLRRVHGASCSSDKWSILRPNTEADIHINPKCICLSDVYGISSANGLPNATSVWPEMRSRTLNLNAKHKQLLLKR